MTGKKVKEKQKKSEHLERLKAAKSKRAVVPILERNQPSRLSKQTILIVCEGENTEPSYFNQFRLTSARIRAFGKGYNTLSLVRQAAQLQEFEQCDQVWCVFDKDSNTANDFNQAIQTAQAHGFKVAYSNQAFEYWLILHFEDHQGGEMPRTDYNDKINHYISDFRASYNGHSDKLISPEFFALLSSNNPRTGILRISEAIIRAKRNYNRLSHHSPANEESSTTVFMLVEEILKYV